MNKEPLNRICTRCIYDSSIPIISFDDKGICNYCREMEAMELQYPTGTIGETILWKLADEMKLAGKGKKYDAILGVSGGCDSSYLLHEMVTKYGLRILAVHYDNTWNSTIASENIHNVLNKLGVDLYTKVVNNKESDDIFKSFLKAGVKDIDIPTDIGFVTTLYEAAEKYEIKYKLDGASFRTEGISPLGWVYMDGKYIQTVQEKFGKYPLKTFPNLLISDFLRRMIFDGVKSIRPIYYMDYDKEWAKKMLAKEYGWQWYGGHHLENRFTAFVHSYFFPNRWGIDFRIAGYSAYCRNGWMTREEALALMNEPPYIESDLVDFVKKRLEFSDAEFEQIMHLPKKTFKDYKTYKKTFERLRPFFLGNL